MPGTTRDAVDTVLRWHKPRRSASSTPPGSGGPAASRGPARSKSRERASSRDARSSSADVVGARDRRDAGPTDQDAAIAGEADKAGRGVIIVANKWDLMKDRGPDFVKEFDERLQACS